MNTIFCILFSVVALLDPRRPGPYLRLMGLYSKPYSKPYRALLMLLLLLMRIYDLVSPIRPYKAFLGSVAVAVAVTVAVAVAVAFAVAVAVAVAAADAL